ncbi:MAG: cytochrome C oxidase subunit IV family protein [Pseudomonadota bacterium]|nr:cytochrome C oxidase subunit IV family protein [Pseudomonadota bacterium]
MNPFRNISFLQDRLAHVWAFLVATTVASWWLGGGAHRVLDSGLTQDRFATTSLIIIIAIIKMRFVIWHFMEVKECPRWLRWTCDAWLLSVAIIVLGLYVFA